MNRQHAQAPRRTVSSISHALTQTRAALNAPALNTARQILATVVITVIWLGLTPIYANLISPYSTYTSARTAGVGLAFVAALAPHLWPSKTAPWRTSAWAMVTTAFLGSVLLLLGADRYALMAATLLGFVIVALRAGQNGRRLVHLVRTFRAIG